MAGYGDAISSIESGGRYDLLGPLTRSGDRAYGRYQIMGNNIGPWTQQYLGQSLTPQQFLSSPQAQDAVFNGRFGDYVQKYGPEGAARAWFAGEGGMNNPGATDMLGTSVSDYARRFNAALGGGASTPAPMATPTPPSAPGLLGTAATADPMTGLGLSSPQQTNNPLAGLLAGLGGQNKGGGFAGLMNMGMQQMTGGAQQQKPPVVPLLPARRIDLSNLRAMLAQPSPLANYPG